MKAQRTCIVCRVRAAALPDRERMGCPVKRVCRACHAARLHADLKRFVEWCAPLIEAE